MDYEVKRPIRILHLEDDNTDAEMIRITLELSKLDCQITYAKSGVEFEKALRSKKFDIILGDYRLPGYCGTSGLKLALEICPDVPFIFVSGTMGEDAAIEGLTEGATDYVLKQKLSRLVPAIKRALNEADNLRENRRIEAELFDSLARYRAVAESAIEGIITIDVTGTIIFWNKASENIFGYSEEEVLGKSILLLFPDSLKEKYENGIGFYTKSQTKNHIERTIEGTGRKKNGIEIPIELSIANWSTHEGVFFTAMVRDISARKSAEKSLRLQSAALEAAANGIVITERNGSISWTNPAFLTLTGYSTKEIIGQNPRLLKSGKNDPSFYKSLWDTIEAGNVWKGEMINKKADGTLYTEEMTISPVRDEKGEISHYIAIKQDISERKQHENEREAIISVADAMRSAPTRKELISIFFHQITNLFMADGCMLAEKDSISEDVVFRFGYGPVGERFIGLHIPAGRGISNKVIHEGIPYFSNNGKKDPQFFRPDLLGESSVVACIPLIAQSNVLGALWIARKETITEAEIKLLSAITNLAANAINRVTLYEQTVLQLQHMASLHQIDTAISSIFPLKRVFNILINNAIKQLGVDAASILLFNKSSKNLEFITGFGLKTNIIHKTKIRLGEGRAGTAALEKRTISMPDLKEAEDDFSQDILRNREGFVSHYVSPLIIKDEIKGVLEVFCRRRIETRPDWFDFFEALSTQAAIAVENANLFSDLQHSNEDLKFAYDATIEGWSKALDLRDKETEGHTQRVTMMAEEMAIVIGLDDKAVTNVRRGSLLHDIGKMGVPDAILLKPDKLSDDEWKIMKMHPTFAYEMLAQIKYLGDAIKIPYCHHEKWDGTGYPRGLKRKQIPLIARIFSLVDVWDAITSDRPYRAAWSVEKALDYILSESGKHFDPDLIVPFLQVINKQTTKS